MSRIVKYDILRVVACFSIILLHVSASYWSVVDVRGGEFLVMTVYNSLTRFAVPVFFMLSGLFLVAPERENVAIGKRVLRLVMLFYVWSAFYAFQGIAVDTLKGAFSMEVFRAFYLRPYPYVVSSDFVRILSVDSDRKADKRKKGNIAVLPASVDRLPVPGTDFDGSFWPGHTPGTD